MSRGVGVLCMVVVLTPGLAGCLDLFVAEVPAAHLTQGWHETGRQEGEAWRGLAKSWVQVAYEVDPTDDSAFGEGPFPASLVVFSVSTPTPSDRDEVATKLDAQVRTNADGQDLRLDDASRRDGERTTRSGVATTYFTYHAEIGTDSSLFQPGQEARVLGEVWFDAPSRITVVVVGLAQVQGSGTIGNRFIDETHWGRMVADPVGTIQSNQGPDGLVWNIKSHD